MTTPRRYGTSLNFGNPFSAPKWQQQPQPTFQQPAQTSPFRLSTTGASSGGNMFGMAQNPWGGQSGMTQNPFFGRGLLGGAQFGMAQNPYFGTDAQLGTPTLNPNYVNGPQTGRRGSSYWEPATQTMQPFSGIYGGRQNVGTNKMPNQAPMDLQSLLQLYGLTQQRRR